MVVGECLPVSKHCVHVKGHGGAKAAVRSIARHLPKHEFVLRTDVKSYYDNIDHHRLLEVLVESGASADILIDAEPHIGSDVLEELVPALRNRIIELGGEVRFGARLDRVEIENGRDLCRFKSWNAVTTRKVSEKGFDKGRSKL